MDALDDNHDAMMENSQIHLTSAKTGAMVQVEKVCFLCENLWELQR